jgi:hypothetical protein
LLLLSWFVVVVMVCCCCHGLLLLSWFVVGDMVRRLVTMRWVARVEQSQENNKSRRCVVRAMSQR